MTSGILQKISPPILFLPLSLLSLTLTAVLPSHLFLWLNFFLRLSVTTPPWTILGIFLRLISPSDSFMPVIKTLPNDVFCPLSGINSQKAYGPHGGPPIVLKNFASVLTNYLVKLFRFCLSTSTLHSCWKYAFIQPVPKKGDRSNTSNYRLISLLSCLSKPFESILNWKIQKHLSTSDHLSDRQYRFRKGRYIGDPLTLLNDSSSFSHSYFGETSSVTLDISKAFGRVWHKFLLSKLPSFGFCLSLCSFTSSFLSGRTISVVVDGYCSSPKLINSGVPQGSVLSPPLSFIHQ